MSLVKITALEMISSERIQIREISRLSFPTEKNSKAETSPNLPKRPTAVYPNHPTKMLPNFQRISRNPPKRGRSKPNSTPSYPLYPTEALPQCPKALTAVPKEISGSGEEETAKWAAEWEAMM